LDSDKKLRYEKHDCQNRGLMNFSEERWSE